MQARLSYTVIAANTFLNDVQRIRLVRLHRAITIASFNVSYKMKTMTGDRKYLRTTL